MKSTHVYAIINRMFSEKRAVGESPLSVSAQDIICWGVKRTHLASAEDRCGENEKNYITNPVTIRGIITTTKDCIT